MDTDLFAANVGVTVPISASYFLRLLYHNIVAPHAFLYGRDVGGRSQFLDLQAGAFLYENRNVDRIVPIRLAFPRPQECSSTGSVPHRQQKPQRREFILYTEKKERRDPCDPAPVIQHQKLN